jgi:ABC-2 type transporter
MDNVITIEAGRSDRHYWLDLWRYRELFRVLAWRDLAVRYKQTVIGVLWALIRPFLTMVVFTIIFGRIAKLPTDGNAPYALMVFAGILPWTFFASGLSEASNSLLNNERLISKVYFPRLIILIATEYLARSIEPHHSTNRGPRHIARARGAARTIVSRYFAQRTPNQSQIALLSHVPIPHWLHEDRLRFESIEWLSTLPLQHGELLRARIFQCPKADFRCLGWNWIFQQ